MLKDYLKEIRQVKSRSINTSKKIYQTRIEQCEIIYGWMIDELNEETEKEDAALIAKAEEFISEMKTVAKKLK